MMDQFIMNASLAMTFGSVVFLTYFATFRLDRNSTEKPLPMSSNKSLGVVNALVPSKGGILIKAEGIPWSPRNGPDVIHRHFLECKAHMSYCKKGSPAYVVVLPEPEGSSSANGSTNGSTNPINTGIFLSTQKHFRTGWPEKYPVATVVIVPPNSKTEYLLDILDNRYDGLRPLLKKDNTLLDMGQKYTYDKNGPGFNVTGNYAHSFVVVNETNHNVYFGKEALNANEISENTAPGLTYWTLMPQSWTLFWPSGIYWTNIGGAPTNGRTWNAASVPVSMQQYDFAASIAENQMYTVLANEMPLVESS